MAEPTLTDVLTAIAVLHDSLAAQGAEVASLRTTVNTGFAAIRGDIDGLGRDVGAMRRDAEAMRRDVEALRRDVEALRGEVEALRQEVDTKIARSEAHILSDLSAQIANILHELHQLREAAFVDGTRLINLEASQAGQQANVQAIARLQTMVRDLAERVGKLERGERA